MLMLLVGDALTACTWQTGSGGRPSIAVPRSQNSPSISFFALGDQGSGSYYQLRVSALMEKVCSKDRDINFTLLLGDNFLGRGVESTTDPKWSTRFEQMYNSPCLGGMPFYATLGNHDYLGNPMAQIEYSRQRRGSARWRMPHFFYSEDFGAAEGRALVRLVVLDSNQPIGSQQKVLESAFGNQNESIWKLVAAHLPIYSYDAKHGPTPHLKETLLPLLKKYKVDLYLSGHAHNLQLIAREAGPVYVVAGGGGSSLYKLLPDKTGALVYGQEQLGFVKIRATATWMNIRFVPKQTEYTRQFRVSRECMRSEHKHACLIP